MDKANYLEFVIEIIKRSDSAKGFEVLPRRWVVERTFGRLGSYLRRIEDKIQELDLIVAVLERSLVNLQRRGDRQQTGFVRTYKPRIAAAVLAAMETLGRPARNIEIKTFLHESGYQFTGIDEDVSIVQALNRLLGAKKVRKIGRGIWAVQT